jgi:glucose-1-phosphate adenylyltransferase
MEILSEKILVMILCGGKGERLYPLTRDRAKPSVPFLGSYRIIDFSLSNSLNSGLRKIALLTQYKSLSLERHILFGWNVFHPESGSYVISLPAQERIGDRRYEGTADAVFQNIYTIQQENVEIMLVLSGDHVYKADYRKIIKFFIEKEADAVILGKLVNRKEATRFGVIEVDKENKIMKFIEKPKNPPPTPWDPQQSLISMGVYLFKTPILIKVLIQDARNRKSNHDFGKDLLPHMIKEYRLYAYPFKGYWEDIGTIDAYWKANMSFLSSTPPFNCQESSWPIRSYKGQYPPSYIKDSSIRNSLVSSGCIICRGILRNSIISPGVRIEEKTHIRDSIILEGVQISKGAKLRKVIVDKFSIIPENFELGYNDQLDSKTFKISREGIRVVPKNWKIS